MKEAAHRFLNGDGVRRSLGRAYYWLRRLKSKEVDVTRIVDTPLQELRVKFSRNDERDLARAERAYGKLVP